MGIRKNDDIDIIISNEIRAQLFGDTSGEIRQNGIEIFAKNRLKFKLFDAQGDTDLIENYSLVVNGYRFLEPRFYFSRKHRDKTERDINDWKMIRLFFEQNTHKTYPFNQLSEEQWGIQYI